jgi:drug/metabolite transporter (DMT)-like permease
MAPLTFRACTLIFAAMGMLLVSRLSGDSIAVPRAWWGRVTALAVLNIGAWNGLVLFGLQHMPAGRSSILAYTMPLWSVLFSMFLLDEPLSRRKLIGLGLGMIGMVVLLGEDFENFQRSPTGALLILGAAVCWAFGTVLLRRWKPQVPQNTLSAHLSILTRARLVTSERHSRSIVYRANLSEFRDLAVFLLRDCCGGRPEVCEPVVESLQACCAPKRKGRIRA